MSQPPPIPADVAVGSVGKSSGVARVVGVLLVLPLLALAVTTLWIPASSLLLNSFQGRGAGVSVTGNWVNAFGFTLSIGIVRMFACILPIGFAIALAFTGSLVRHVARTVFLLLVLLLGPLSYGYSVLITLYQLQPGIMAKPFNAQVALLCAELLLTSAAVTAIALWLFPGIKAAADSEKQGATRGRLLLVVVLLLGVLASGLQAVILSLSTFGGPKTSTATLNLLLYNSVESPVPSSAAVSIQLVITGILGLVSGILLVAGNLHPSLRKLPLKAESAGCVLAALLGLILSVTSIFAMLPQLACILGLVGPKGGSALTFLTPSLLSELTPGIQHQVILVAAWFIIVVPITYLAALGIGGLRPIGRHSEWLLLPFFPFFFISIGTLWPFFFDLIHRFHLYNNPLAVIYPILTNVPFLIFLTLFFKGQREAWIEATPGRSFFQAVILPSLPVTITFAVASSVFVVRDALCQLISSGKENNLAQVLLISVEELATRRISALILLFTAGSLLVFPLLALLQILVVDRIRIRAR